MAVVGLLGHGLAMLLVGVLLQAPAAAPSGFPGYVEICTASGLKKVAWNDGSGRNDAPFEENKPASDPASGKVEGCPVCNAFAQNGLADLPQPLVLFSREYRTVQASPAHQIAPAAPGKLLALSRGPPPAA